MFQPIDSWSLIRNSAVWWSPIVAGFIGALGVHLLTQSRERENWILDSKKAEFRELLSAVSKAHISTRRVSHGFAYSPSAEYNDRYSSIFLIQDESLRFFSDRLFITNDLPLDTLRESWSSAMKYYSYNQKSRISETNNQFINEEFDREYDRIKNTIIAAAIRSVPKTTWQRLMFWKK
jgi:hypothetical protein